MEPFLFAYGLVCIVIALCVWFTYMWEGLCHDDLVTKHGAYRGNTLFILWCLWIIVLWPVYLIYKFANGLIRGK